MKSKIYRYTLMDIADGLEVLGMFKEAGYIDQIMVKMAAEDIRKYDAAIDVFSKQFIIDVFRQLFKTYPSELGTYKQTVEAWQNKKLYTMILNMPKTRNAMQEKGFANPDNFKYVEKILDYILADYVLPLYKQSKLNKDSLHTSLVDGSSNAIKDMLRGDNQQYISITKEILAPMMPTSSMDSTPPVVPAGEHTQSFDTAGKDKASPNSATPTVEIAPIATNPADAAATKPTEPEPAAAKPSGTSGGKSVFMQHVDEQGKDAIYQDITNVEFMLKDIDYQIDTLMKAKAKKDIELAKTIADREHMDVPVSSVDDIDIMIDNFKKRKSDLVVRYKELEVKGQKPIGHYNTQAVQDAFEKEHPDLVGKYDPYDI